MPSIFRGTQLVLKPELPQDFWLYQSNLIPSREILRGTQFDDVHYYYYLDLGNVDSERIFSKSEHDERP